MIFPLPWRKKYATLFQNGGERMKKIGLYIHIPFCVTKCPYCDFYSLPLNEQTQREHYTAAILDAVDCWAERLKVSADTLYFGGGTPSLLGGEYLSAIIRRVGERFSLFDGTPEITLEANPADDLYDTLSSFAAAGGNRLSLGMQSACSTELDVLGRRHTTADVERTVADARRAGLDNISLDVMLGVSGQTATSAVGSVRRAADLGAAHVSAYMLKIEEGTPYAACPPSLPDEDAVADMYLAIFDELERLGYRQYEISNAALNGQESRHNLKYWDCQPYLGIGPAASSCIGGHRFAYPRDLVHFMSGGMPMEEEVTATEVDSPEEYALLRLRLADGIEESAYLARFGTSVPVLWRQRAASLPSELVKTDDGGIRLTRQGFLLSNSLIRHILAK